MTNIYSRIMMRHLSFIVILLSLFAVSSVINRAYAITFDAKSQSSTIGFPTTSWQHTIANNSNRLLVVTVGGQSTGFGGSPTVTFNGLPLTLYKSVACYGGSSCQIATYYLINPPVGTFTISANAGVALGSATGGAMSYYNADTTTPFKNFTSSSGLVNDNSTVDTNLSVAGTTASDTVIDSMFILRDCNSKPTITPGTGQTLLWSVAAGNNCTPNDTGASVFSSTKPGSDTTTLVNWHIVRPKDNSGTTWVWGDLATVLNQPSTGSNSFTGSVFIDANKNGTKDAGEAGYSGATVQMVNQSTGATVNGITNSTGNYSVQMSGTGTFCIALPTLPSGYTATTTQGPTGCFTVSGSGNTTSNSFDFGITAPSTYTISGNIFDDTNKNGLKDAAENNYTAAPTITITPNVGTISTNSNGSFAISNLPSGTYTVSYNSLPTGYRLTYPLSGPPPSFRVTVGSACNTNGAQGASCQ